MNKPYLIKHLSRWWIPRPKAFVEEWIDLSWVRDAQRKNNVERGDNSKKCEGICRMMCICAFFFPLTCGWVVSTLYFWGFIQGFKSSNPSWDDQNHQHIGWGRLVAFYVAVTPRIFRRSSIPSWNILAAGCLSKWGSILYVVFLSLMFSYVYMIKYLRVYHVALDFVWMCSFFFEHLEHPHFWCAICCMIGQC